MQCITVNITHMNPLFDLIFEYRNRASALHQLSLVAVFFNINTADK